VPVPLAARDVKDDLAAGMPGLQDPVRLGFLKECAEGVD
jgi:hypothetical protein